MSVDHCYRIPSRRCLDGLRFRVRLYSERHGALAASAPHGVRAAIVSFTDDLILACARDARNPLSGRNFRDINYALCSRPKAEASLSVPIVLER